VSDDKRSLVEDVDHLTALFREYWSYERSGAKQSAVDAATAIYRELSKLRNRVVTQAGLGGFVYVPDNMVPDREVVDPTALTSLDYWLGVLECRCSSEHPIGGCLYCDLKHIREQLTQ